MYYTIDETAYAMNMLRTLLKDGDVVFTILRYVSESGMTRHIDLVTFKDNSPVWLSYHTARVLDYPQVKDESSLKIKGRGMDMGYHTVYSLGRVLKIKLNHRWL
jgi:hypothetical protein